MKYDKFETTLQEECDIQSEKLGVIYNESDSRCWSALIGRDKENLIVTFHVNRGDLGEKSFDIIGNRKKMLKVPEREIYDILDELITN